MLYWCRLPQGYNDSYGDPKSWHYYRSATRHEQNWHPGEGHLKDLLVREQDESDVLEWLSGGLIKKMEPFFFWKCFFLLQWCCKLQEQNGFSFCVALDVSRFVSLYFSRGLNIFRFWIPSRLKIALFNWCRSRTWK